jgi:excinuclease ABC subunit A
LKTLRKKPAEIAEETIEIFGAREHNLKNIDIVIPRNQLVVLTGLSGSGKSSLAFDTIFAEGQRRYIESFAAYARQFLGNLERPNVDKINGLSPVISIEQKTVNRSPRSTVGTITEIYDFLRLLYARAADAFSYNTGKKMVQYTDQQMVDMIMERFDDRRLYFLAPLVRSRKGHYRELFQKVIKQGFTKVRVDGELIDVKPRMMLDRYKNHDIEMVIDRLKIEKKYQERINESLKLSLRLGKGAMMVLDAENGDVQYLSRNLMCPDTGIAYDLPAPNLFSFNSPKGACRHCNGLGTVSEISLEKIIPDARKSIKQGALAPLGPAKPSWVFRQIEAISEKFGFTMNTPFREIPADAVNTILYGSSEELEIKSTSASVGSTFKVQFNGLVNYLSNTFENEDAGTAGQRWAESFTNKVTCPDCHGSRLLQEAMFFKLDDKSIADLAGMDILTLERWFENIETRLSQRQNTIAGDLLKEIRARIGFLLKVGLDYLTLDRPAGSLSGGEAQRIRLATQIGSQLVGVLYILDEPSIGLHQRDNHRLIASLQRLRDGGNSVLVVEHDKDMILAADHVIDIGPGAGIHGGRIVAQGKPEVVLKSNTLTADYLTGRRSIQIPPQRRTGNGKNLILTGATGHNLKNVILNIPLGTFTVVTGVSGSGKSSLINETLYPILNQHFYRSIKKPLPYKKITGLEHIDKVIEIDQSPIGRTPRSNPATYTGLFADIRDLFARLPESKIRGYKPGRFSFNVKGGRCETCKGAGMQTIEMNFLPDVYVLCESCNGKRYNRETLEVRYKGKSISDVLNMPIEETTEFFAHIPALYQKIKTLQEVGLGYVTLGQSSTTLSGGEAQRVKLAAELAKRDTGNTLYILDEPTTGLHFEDIRVLLEVLQRLTDHGNTVVVIEHNMDMVKVADWVIDLGLEGGAKGGNVVFEGTVADLLKNYQSHTAHYLRQELGYNVKK